MCSPTHQMLVTITWYMEHHGNKEHLSHESRHKLTCWVSDARTEVDIHRLGWNNTGKWLVMWELTSNVYIYSAVVEQLYALQSPFVRPPCSIDYSLITFNWFLTVFVDNIPPDMMVQIWDTFLYEGDKVLFRFAIAIFKYYEEEIVRIKEPLKLYSFLRQMSSQVFNIARLKQVRIWRYCECVRSESDQ